MSIRKPRVTTTSDRVRLQASTERAAKARYLRALAEAIAAYEAKFGAISEEEMIARQREDRRTSIKVR